jgi:RNA recognition motif-containing protein
MSPITGGKPEKERKDKKHSQYSSKTSSGGVSIGAQPSAKADAEAETIDEDAMPIKKRKRESTQMEEIEVDVTAPEPPSKKALRRAKKGKPISTTASKSTKSGAYTSDVNSDGEKKAKRSDYGIWIGNLPFSVTKADIRKFLIEKSLITDDQITRVHLPSPNSPNSVRPARKLKPQNKGFAYIDLSTESVLDKALELSETLLSGRRVLIKNAKSFKGRPEKPSDATLTGRSSGKPPSKKVFVGNLSFDTTEEDLREHFSRCGVVKTVFIATFEDSGKCKGFALVEFEDLEAAEAAVRGWVKVPIKEEEEGESSEATEDTGGEEGGEKKGNRMKKWWVNRIRGRALRMEFAEDKVVRYKKRYGKGGTARVTTAMHADVPGLDSVKVDGELATADISKPSRPPRKKDFSGKERLGRLEGTSGKVDARTIKPGAALANAQRMTGGIVESKGTKITFDD